MCVCRECAQAVLPPALSRPMYNVHVHQHQCTSPPTAPPPQITKQKGLRLVSGLGLPPLPPLLLTPLHLPSWTIGPLSSTRVQEEKKYRSIREYILRIQNCGEIQFNSWGLRSTIGWSRVLRLDIQLPRCHRTFQIEKKLHPWTNLHAHYQTDDWQTQQLNVYVSNELRPDWKQIAPFWTINKRGRRAEGVTT